MDSRENSLSSSQVHIVLRVSTPQDILAELGKPSRVFYKEEDKMKIHSVTDDGEMIGRPSDDRKGDQAHPPVNEEDDKGNIKFLRTFHLRIVMAFLFTIIFILRCIDFGPNGLLFQLLPFGY